MHFESRSTPGEMSAVPETACRAAIRSRLDADRDRQIEASSLFRQLRRREIDGEPSLREFELRILQCSTHVGIVQPLGRPLETSATPRC
jgi:hypothetical protein